MGDLGVSPRVNVSVNFLLGRLMQWGFEWPMVDLSGLDSDIPKNLVTLSKNILKNS